MLGDGSIHDPPSARNVRFQVTNINRPFLGWISDELGIHSNEVSLHRDANAIEAQNKRNAPDRFAAGDYDIRDQYVLSTTRHPELNQFRNWYGDQKRFPHCLTLSPTVLELWYACDGSLLWGTKGHQRPQARIAAENEADRQSFLGQLFEPTPCDPTVTDGRIMFTADDTERLLDYITSPTPGFEYKFETSSRERYFERKEAFYRRNTTINATDGSPTTGGD
jgi:hypothetical protein